MTLNHLSMLLAVVGLGCFLWPMIGRLRGEDRAPEPLSGFASPWRIAGFALTILALVLQRTAAGQGG